MKALWRDLRTLRFWRHFFINAFACMGVIYSLLEAVVGFFPSLEAYKGWRALAVFVLMCIAFGLTRSWPRPIRENYGAPKTAISIEEGDILNEPGHIVIGACDTFDTETPHIISRGSVQGQAQERLFNNDEKELDRLIGLRLAGQTPVGTIQKAGKTTQYELGTVLPITHGARLVYLMAYCQMNDKNEARATVDGVWKSLLKLWEQVSATANGATVAMPLIGGGQARLSSILPAQDSLRLIILSFMFASRKEKVCDELRIVVHPRDYERLDRLELQAFLSSLKPS